MQTPTSIEYNFTRPQQLRPSEYPISVLVPTELQSNKHNKTKIMKSKPNQQPVCIISYRKHKNKGCDNPESQLTNSLMTI